MANQSAAAELSEATAAPDVQSIAKDDVFHILQAPRRRAVLRYLIEHNDREEFTMRDLAEEIAAWENGTSVEQLTSKPRSRVYIALYQNHLPKLADYGVIEYNQSRGIITPTPLLYVFEPYLGDGLHAHASNLTVPADEPPASPLSAAASTLFSH